MTYKEPLWSCPDCGAEVRCEPLAGDDWGGEEVAVGPDCDKCGEAMEWVDEAEEETQ